MTNTKNNSEIVIGLKKAQSHLGKVIKMVEDKEYCVDIMQQIMAIIGLLKSANQKVLTNHLHNCFMNAFKGSNEARKKEMIEEILQLEKMNSK
jgi:DNA-binding FrmR family transcriptional regulator